MTAPDRRRPAPSGFSLPETVLALALGGLVCVGLLNVLVAEERATAAHAGRRSAAEALRMAAVVLGGELRPLRPATDVRALGPDSVALRAFRGTAVVCAPSDAGVLVRYAGMREPEPAKDSIVVVGPAAETAVALGTTEPADGCAPAEGEQVLRWTFDDAPPAGTLLLLFESGSYHLSGDALRYRRGAGGRQPLSDAVIDVSVSRLAGLDPGGGSTVEPARVAAVEAIVAARLSAGPADSARDLLRVRVPFRNRSPPPPP